MLHKINWFKNIDSLFRTERVRTIIKVEGNILKVLFLDTEGKPAQRTEKKFKNSTKLKKFWEQYVTKYNINFYLRDKVFYCTSRLDFKI